MVIKLILYGDVVLIINFSISCKGKSAHALALFIASPLNFYFSVKRRQSDIFHDTV
jgi:hypothetical protein